MKIFRSLLPVCMIATMSAMTPAAAQTPASPASPATPAPLADYPADYAREPRFKALVWYTPDAEEAHVAFARQGVEFFRRLNYGDGFVLEITDDLSAYPYEKLREYTIVVMLNGYPRAVAERAAFERYMEDRGGWMGFHAAAYNDPRTGWPWLVDFLGGGVFLCNNWPAQPAKLTVDTHARPGAHTHTGAHPVTRNLPREFIAPETEWYQWSPSPRANPDVEVLLTLSPDNYPLGIKDVMLRGDTPVVWTNRRYRMIYLNMGHNEAAWGNPTQDLLFINSFRWVVSSDPAGDPFGTFGTFGS